MKSKSRRKPKHIIARSITLKDAKGKKRIHLDAGDGDGYATICLFGENDSSIQISSLPENAVHVSLQSNKRSLAFAITEDAKAGFQINDEKGRLGIMLGGPIASGEHHLTVFRNGQACWSTSKLAAKKSKK